MESSFETLKKKALATWNNSRRVSKKNNDFSMRFQDIVGYEDVKQDLRSMAISGKIPHNILIEQEDGAPGIALAWAFFQYLNCEKRGETDSCGECRHCRMISQLQYADLYFIYPVVNGTKFTAPSDEFFDIWRELLIKKGTLFSSEDWLSALNAENSQPIIYSSDADALHSKLALHISESGYRMVIIYQPEKMNVEMANKLLKMMEEPPEKTLFCSISNNPEQLLETIISRMQKIELHPLSRKEIKEYISTISPNSDSLDWIASCSEGILLRALELMGNGDRNVKYHHHILRLLIAMGQRNVAQIKEVTEEIASLGREYSLATLRTWLQNMRLALHFSIDPALVSRHADQDHEKIIQILGHWVTIYNIDGITQIIEDAIKHIRGNVNSKYVLFDATIGLLVSLSAKIKESRNALKQRV